MCYVYIITISPCLTILVLFSSLKLNLQNLFTDKEWNVFSFVGNTQAFNQILKYQVIYILPYKTKMHYMVQLVLTEFAYWLCTEWRSNHWSPGQELLTSCTQWSNSHWNNKERIKNSFCIGRLWHALWNPLSHVRQVNFTCPEKIQKLVQHH